LPGFEPFRWMRAYPPGMFDGLWTWMLRRTGRGTGQPTNTGTSW
jgi:hypothetical protein